MELQNTTKTKKNPNPSHFLSMFSIPLESEVSVMYQIQSFSESKSIPIIDSFFYRIRSIQFSGENQEIIKHQLKHMLKDDDHFKNFFCLKMAEKCKFYNEIEINRRLLFFGFSVPLLSSKSAHIVISVTTQKQTNSNIQKLFVTQFPI